MMGLAIKRIPQLGHVFYVQGYSGHGIATSHFVGEIMAKSIRGHLEGLDTFANCSHI